MSVTSKWRKLSFWRPNINPTVYVIKKSTECTLRYGKIRVNTEKDVISRLPNIREFAFCFRTFGGPWTLLYKHEPLSGCKVFKVTWTWPPTGFTQILMYWRVEVVDFDIWFELDCLAVNVIQESITCVFAIFWLVETWSNDRYFCSHNCYLAPFLKIFLKFHCNATT